jgi:hypothetical protein
MAFIKKIREQSGFLVGLVVIGFLFTFLFTSGSIRFFSFFSDNNKSAIGTVVGKSLSKEEYDMQLRLMAAKYNSKSVSDKILQDQAWYTLIQKYILQQEYSDLGIAVNDIETVDIVQGENIHPRVKLEPAFLDEATKAFDKRKLIAYLQRLPEMSKEEQSNWYTFERSIIESRKFDKLLNIIRKSIYLTELDIQSIYYRNTKEVFISYLYIPYSNVDVDNIQISDSQIKAYINEHKEAYQVEESMKIKYVVFNIEPSGHDTTNFNSEMSALCENFSQTKDDILFARANTDGDLSSVSLKFDSDSIPNFLKEVNLKVGTVVGPIDLGYAYRIYKVSKVNKESAKTFYEMAVVEKKLVAGEQSRNLAYATASKCVSSCKNIVDLEKWALNEAMPIEEIRITKNETRLRNKENARSLIRWLYSNKVGALSSVFEIENSYIVAIATEKIDKGIIPLEMIRDEVIRKLENKYKSEHIIKKLNSNEFHSLKMAREVCDFGANLVENYKLKFSTNVLPEAGIATRAIGAAFGLAIGDIKIIADDYGVFVIELVRISDKHDELLDDSQLKSILRSKYDKDLYASFIAMEELASVVDNRYLFY